MFLVPGQKSEPGIGALLVSNHSFIWETKESAKRFVLFYSALTIGGRS